MSKALSPLDGQLYSHIDKAFGKLAAAAAAEYDKRSLRPFQPATLREGSGSGIRPGLRGIARRPEKKPLDLVYLPSDSRLGAQCDISCFRDLFPTGSGSLLESRHSGNTLEGLHPLGESGGGASD